MSHRYHLQLTGAGDQTGAQIAEFEFESHDDLSVVLAKIAEKKIFEDEEETKAFAVGLKLFTGVLLQHRSHPLFAELGPKMGEFMKMFKAYSPAQEK